MTRICTVILAAATFAAGSYMLLANERVPMKLCIKLAQEAELSDAEVLDYCIRYGY